MVSSAGLYPAKAGRVNMSETSLSGDRQEKTGSD